MNWYFILRSILFGLLVLGQWQCTQSQQKPNSDTLKNQFTSVSSNEPEKLPDSFDIVLQNGRVINPETKLDAEGYYVGITGGTITAVTQTPISGRLNIDAKGLVIAPGFIDVLSYEPNPLGVWNKIADGVTTNLALHGGATYPDQWYATYAAQRPPVHFGAGFFYSEARNVLKMSLNAPATANQRAEMKKLAIDALNKGALCISFSLEYVPGIDSLEILQMMELAYQYNVPVFFHARYSDMEEPGTNFDALYELIRYATKTKAAVHIDHINSTGGTFSMKRSLAILDSAREAGLDFSACLYPYNFWGTKLNTHRFGPGWQKRFRISYQDLQLGGSSERLTAETFEKYKKQGKLAVAYAIPEEDVVEAIKCPWIMLGSDAILEPTHNNHPRASGTFARVLGKYVREEKVITLAEAIHKMSYLPCKRLEKQAPAFRKKGRIAVGCDADITVFNPLTVADQATVENPEKPSIGIEYVFVNGKIVKDKNGLKREVRYGRGIRTELVPAKYTTETRQFGSQSIPLLIYREQLYLPVQALHAFGIELRFNHHLICKRITNREPSSFQFQKIEGLVLERGHQLQLGTEVVKLVSVKEQLFYPVQKLALLGLTANQTKIEKL